MSATTNDAIADAETRPVYVAEQNERARLAGWAPERKHTMPTMYEIDAEFRHLAAILEEFGGELTPELDMALAINDADFERKAEAYAGLIREMEAEATAFANEAARMKARADAKTKAGDRLKSRLAAALEARGGKAEVGTFALSLRRSETVIVDSETDAATLPDDLVKFVPATTTPDKTAIKAAIKSGREVPGCRLDVRQNLQIK